MSARILEVAQVRGDTSELLHEAAEVVGLEPHALAGLLLDLALHHDFEALDAALAALEPDEGEEVAL